MGGLLLGLILFLGVLLEPRGADLGSLLGVGFWGGGGQNGSEPNSPQGERFLFVLPVYNICVISCAVNM